MAEQDKDVNVREDCVFVFQAQCTKTCLEGAAELTINNEQISFVMLCATVTDGGENHHEQREYGHLSSRIATGPFFLRITNAKESVEDGQDETKDIEQN